jgi:hypothetical protein
MTTAERSIVTFPRVTPKDRPVAHQLPLGDDDRAVRTTRTKHTSRAQPHSLASSQHANLFMIDQFGSALRTIVVLFVIRKER